MEEQSVEHLTTHIFPNLDSAKYEETNEIFTEEDLSFIKKQNLKEPNWKFLIDWLPKSAIDYYFKNLERIYSTSQLMFIKGVINEYGIKCPINYNKALYFYDKSLSYNNQLALFKMYHIYSKEKYASQFEVKVDIDLAVYCLIKSVCYSDVLPEIVKIDPIMKLVDIINQRDRDYSRTKQLLIKMNKVNNNSNLVSTEIENKFLLTYVQLNFCTSIIEFHNNMAKLADIAKINRHFEACFKMACLYYYPPQNDLSKKNIPEALELMHYLFENKYWKSYYSYFKILEDLKEFEKLKVFSKELLLEVKQFSLQFYCSYLCRDRENFYNNAYELLEYSFLLFLNGSIMSSIVCFEILSQVCMKNKITDRTILDKINENYYDNESVIVFSRINENIINGINDGKDKDLAYTTNNINSSNNLSNTDINKRKYKMNSNKNIKEVSEKHSPHHKKKNTLNENINDNRNSSILNLNESIMFHSSHSKKDRNTSNINFELGNNNEIKSEYYKQKILFYSQVIFEFCVLNDNKKWLYELVDYDIYVLFYVIKSYYYYRGIYVEKNIPKAISIIEESLLDKKSYKNYRKGFYYLGKLYKQLNYKEKSDYYFFRTFKIYLLSSEFPYHYYLLGKFYFTGIDSHLKRDIKKSIFFLNLGKYFKDNNYFINVLYSKKCESKLDYYRKIDSEFSNVYDAEEEKIKIRGEIKLEDDTDKNILKSLEETKIGLIMDIIEEKEVCFLCVANFRQIIFYNCGHKHICLTCFDKIKNSTGTAKKCPICNAESSIFINDLE